MGNLMTSMYTGVSGLMVNQASINVTAHNISNIDTRGFTRQQILSTDFIYNRIGQGGYNALKVGLGTNMASIRQVRDTFLDAQYRLELGRESFYDSQSKAVEELESLFGELEGEAFKNNLNDFWTAVSEIAKEPGNIANRGILVSTANSFLKKAGIINDQLEEYQVNLNSEIQKSVNRINEIGDSIKALNQIIVKYESAGQEANDYRDTRNNLLDELGAMVGITYKENKQGIVTVNVEGVQFVSEDQVYHMETQTTVTPEEQERADAINGYITAISDLRKQMEANGKSTAEIEEAVKSSDEWRTLSKYGKVKYQTTGDISFNDFTILDKDNKMEAYMPKQSDLLTVHWKGNGCGEVFRLDGDYSAAAKKDIGSLKGLLVARGAYGTNYTSIPKESDYANKKDYDAAVKEYNKYVDTSVVMTTKAQFDQLIHEIITKMNDIFAPNTEITEDKISELLTKTGTTPVTSGQVDLTKATIRLADGTTIKASEAQIFDKINAGCGIDKDKTQGEALFERKNLERYTKGTLTVVIDNTPTEIEVLVYNEEYASDNYSLFTIGEIEINEEILNDNNKIPLNNNKYSGLSEGFNQDICAALVDAWDVEDLKLNPNTLTKNNFKDYYSSMIIGVAYRGKTYNDIAKNQSELVNQIENGRQQVAGVSSEDELTNLIKFQHAYNASSRYITTINDMLGHIIEKLG